MAAVLAPGPAPPGPRPQPGRPRPGRGEARRGRPPAPRAAALPPPHSAYLVRRLLNQPATLYSTAKFALVAQQIAAVARRGGRLPRVLDLGCADRAALRGLRRHGVAVEYCGVDYEAAFGPDVVGDVRDGERLARAVPWPADVILLLDVLEHLPGREADIRRALAGCEALLAPGGVVLAAVPEMYRLDRLKLPHLRYPEHAVRLTLEEWRALLGERFAVRHAQGIGYLSVLPYLVMLSRRYREDGPLGRLFHGLRGRVFEWAPLKPADVFLSRTVGRVGPLRPWANDCLLVCVPRGAAAGGRAAPPSGVRA